MQIIKISLTLIFLALFGPLYANKNAAEIYLKLNKLYSLKRVLYIAAHPDDENTRALAWFSNGENAETAYLSLTRGSGGQNLIGDELGASLGVLRTEELLAARSYDGARQFFTRANDFGYSKSADESLEKWGKDALLEDVVLVIRKFRPDVIITRFPPDARGGHGHHTASAMLAIEAFEKAGDPNYLPKQVEQYGTWRTTSIYWNTSYWWMKEIADSAKKYPERYLIQDIGGYNPYLGMSYNEIGTIARSQHKCQGFGAIIERGSQLEYFEYLAGQQLKSSFFELNHESWEKLVNKELQHSFEVLLDQFDFRDPAQNLSLLLSIRKNLEHMKDSPLKKEKISLCEEIIADCMGLYLEVSGKDFSFVSNEELKLSINGLNRSNIPLVLKSVAINEGEAVIIGEKLEQNQNFEKEITIRPKAQISTPYWLRKPYNNVYDVTAENQGKAKGDPTLMAHVVVSIENNESEFDLPVIYKWREPSFGEKRRDMICTPSFTANYENGVLLCKPESSKVVKLLLHGFSETVKDELQIETPKGWKVSPSVVPVDLRTKNEERMVEFTLMPLKNAENGEITFKNKAGEQIYSFEEIAYDHIPTQVIQSPTTIKVIHLDAKIERGKIAYIKGVEDAVTDAIRALGFEVEEYNVNDLASLDLTPYRSVVLGIRIYNVYPELTNHHNKLFDYVSGGGNLIMQYNTASRSQSDQTFGPVPFELSRNRVTEEDAEVTLLQPNHPIFNQPNKINLSDFNGWIQERGLYFADNWDKSYTPLISWHDKGEDAQLGGLIVLKHGKGQFVYTGISFFRELPNGVVGAYRLFANLLSYKHE